MILIGPSSLQVPRHKLNRGGIWILGLLVLSLAAPLQATQLDPAALIDAVRNDKPDEVQAQLSAGAEAGGVYLCRYAQVLLPAVARIGTPTTLNMMVEAMGRARLGHAALDRALVAAFENPHPNQIVELLLALGANPSAKVLGHTALARAAFAHSRRNDAHAINAIKLLLAKGADRNATEDSGMSPLMWACSSGDAPVVKLLLPEGVNIAPLTREHYSHFLALGPACADLLKPKVGDSDPVVPASHAISQDPVLVQALYQAVMTGDLEHTADLLKQGVSANAVIEDTAQSLLMLTRNAGIASLLLTHGANTEWTDAKGWTALHKLVTCPGTGELVKILLTAGANIHHCIENGQNALLLTHLLFVDKLDATSGREILRLLVKAGADINSADGDGETLLHLAAYNDAADLATIALELGADPEQPNERGETPLRLAKRLQANAVLKVLTQHLSNNAVSAPSHSPPLQTAPSSVPDSK